MSQTKLYLFGAIGGLVIAGIVILFLALTNKETIVVDEGMFGSWHVVEPTDGLFTAVMPRGPEETSTQIPVSDVDGSILQRSYVSSDENGSDYFISTLVYPVPFRASEAKTILGGALEGMVQAVDGNVLEKSRFETYNDLPSVDFAITNGEFNYQGKIMLGDRVLYQLFVAYESGKISDQAYVYFLSSFEPKTP